MTDPLTPALGEEVFPEQNLGVIDGDPGSGPTGRKHHNVPMIEADTRKIVGFKGPLSGGSMQPAERIRGLRPGRVLIYWGVQTGPTLQGQEYLPYPPLDGIPIPSSPAPVNPLELGKQWRDILSRFAHDVMEFNPKSNHLRDADTHKTGHLPPTDAAAMLQNKVTYQLARGVIGVAFSRVLEWMTLDAQRLAQYPASVPDDENWKIWQDGVIPVAANEIQIPNLGDMMTALCGDQVKEIGGFCVGAWVYLLNDRIDASTYDSNMNSGGEIRLPDPAWDQWRPQLFLHRVTGTRSERSDQWGDIMVDYSAAHDHYLTSVAPKIEHAPV